MNAFDITRLTGKTLGNYEVERILGRGGMGVVYKARQISLNRIVALKLLYPDLSRDVSLVKRFQREAYAVAQLSHKNIIQIFDIGEEDGLHFFSMEYISGRSLKQMLEKEGFLNPESGLEIMAQATSALAHAHRRNIIHRDIKPSNIMIDRAGRVKVMDFGLAKFASDFSEVTGTGAVLGTPRYMSPEQCRGELLDPRSDIYSLGVLFYEMLAGRSPFSAPDNMALMHKIIYEQPPDLKAMNPKVPRGLSDVVARAMRKKAEERYAKASEFHADIRRFQALYKDDPEKLLENERREAIKKKIQKPFAFFAVTLLLLLSFGIAYWYNTMRPPPFATGMYDIAEYFPIHMGDRRTFRALDGSLVVQTVPGNDTVCGRNAARMEMSNGHTFWYDLDAEGLWLSQAKNPDGVTTVPCFQEPILDRKLSVGYHRTIQFEHVPIYDQGGNQFAESAGSFSAVFDKVDTLTLSGGRSVECLHVVFNMTQFISVGGGMASTTAIESWFAKGIGTVRTTGDPGEILVLESAIIDGQDVSMTEAQKIPPQPSQYGAQRTTISDPAGNLQGDRSKAYLDVIQAELVLRNDVYTFTVRTAKPFPESKDMAGKRLDIMMFVDSDRNMRTGKSSLGDEYIIDLFLNENGWASNWNKLTDKSRADGIQISPNDFKITVRGAEASLSFPMRYLPSSLFDWWVYCGTINAPSWVPQTHNPGTAKSTFVVSKTANR